MAFTRDVALLDAVQERSISVGLLTCSAASLLPRARRLADGKLVVVKEIKTTALNAKLKAAVMDEVENLAKLTHPNIVKYCDCFMDDVYINIVMEYCDSGDLSGMIEARKEKHFDEDAIMFNFVQVRNGMQIEQLWDGMSRACP